MKRSRLLSSNCAHSSFRLPNGQSTDTGDYFPEGYDPEAEIAFTSGMGGSQASNQERGGPQLPGMENLGADAVVTGGIEQAEDIPDGMTFEMDQFPPPTEVEMQVAASSSGSDIVLSVAPTCMTFEDYFAGFTSDSHSSIDKRNSCILLTFHCRID